MSEGIEIKRARHIPLTRGQFAIVDADDYEALSKYKWHAMKPYSGGYMAVRSISKSKRCEIFMHREITHCPQNMQVDHINHDTLDNRKSNLRICTRSQNQHNRLKNKDGTSRYKGVYWHKRNRKWQTRITGNGKHIYSGYFNDEIEAAKAYDVVAMKHFGEFAYLNFPKK